MTENKKDNSVQASGGEMDTQTLFCDIRSLIEETRSSVATVVNAGLTLLNWQIGSRIQTEVLNDQRAEYGKEILATLSQQLAKEYGGGYSYSALTRMAKFVDAFPDSGIVATLSRQLSWSHFKELIPLNQPLQRDFYAEMCRIERWSVRMLRKKIDGMLYERTAISKKPDEVVKAELNQSGIHVAEYMTGLPSRELLEQKLHSAVETAKARLIEPRK